MKRWALFTLVMLVMSVCFVSSLSGISVNNAIPRAGINSSRPDSGRAGDPPAADSASYAAPQAYNAEKLDPNKVAAAIRAFPGLEQQLIDVGRSSRNEITQWLRPVSSTADNRSRLAREVQKQIEAELVFLRKVANEEGAKKTVAAIDGLMLVRQSRLEKLSEKMAEENDKEDEPESESATSGRGRRSSTGIGTSGGRRSRSGTSGQDTSTEDGTSSSSRRRSR
ncbi:MAG: hypothetical protein JW720_01125 [Sedimentisphaerales bacterium]|nr:hypothetical protein [Sedimentisphaerales bacterium]